MTSSIMLGSSSAFTPPTQTPAGINAEMQIKDERTKTMSMKKLNSLAVGQSMRLQANPEILRFLEENNNFSIIKRQSGKSKNGYCFFITVEKVWEYC